jgi:transposase
MKGVVGIDISKATFHACFMIKMDNNVSKILGSTSFDNTDSGAMELLKWVAKKNREDVSVIYVMEATGVYYENLAYFLYESEQEVAVILALKMKNYMKSFNVKTKTDKVDSKVIAEYGIERSVELWKPMSGNYRQLRDLSRESMSITKEITRAKNQLHALKHSKGLTEFMKQMKEEQIEFYKNLIKRLRAELKSQAREDKELYEKIKRLETIPGIGLETAIVLVSETNGFQLIKNTRQLVSYAGLDVSHKESGTYKGRSKISKKGNRRIRQALYMPAMAAIRSNVSMKQFSERINEKNPKMKKKSIVACMRKLLILSYVIWKKEEVFDLTYTWNSTSGKEETKPSFGQKKRSDSRSALDRLR